MDTAKDAPTGEPAFRAASLAVQGTWSPGEDDVAVTRSSEYANRVVEVVEKALLDNGWRPPLPEWETELSDLLGIDRTKRIYTESDLMEAYSAARKRWDEGLDKVFKRIEWGYRFYDHDAVLPSTQEIAEQRADLDRSIEVVFRRVGEWEGAD